MNKALNRYDQLLHAIDLFKPKTIAEVGTWNGQNAIRMIKHAQKYRKNVVYVGYDLFEDATAETDSAELNVKRHNHVLDVEAEIRKACPDAEIQLIKGNTRETLTPISADLAYIDGGHSVETIQHDYEMCKHSNVVIFDDFYIADKDGKCPDLELYGCNKIVADIGKAIILPVGGEVKEGGITMMAMVIRGDQ